MIVNNILCFTEVCLCSRLTHKIVMNRRLKSKSFHTLYRTVVHNIYIHTSTQYRHTYGTILLHSERDGTHTRAYTSPLRILKRQTIVRNTVNCIKRFV